MAVSDLLPDDETRPLVVVSVGTDHHRFDRLVQWTEEFAATRSDAVFIVQRGTSRTPKGVTSQELIPHKDIQEMFRRAAVVVSHGGPSTVMDARAQGRLPVVVARNPEFGEHVDGHQMRFAAHLAANGIAKVANTETEFVTLLTEALEDPKEFAIELADVSVPPGVVRMGQVLDGLLGVTTPLTRPSTNDSAQASASATRDQDNTSSDQNPSNDKQTSTYGGSAPSDDAPRDDAPSDDAPGDGAAVGNAAVVNKATKMPAEPSQLSSHVETPRT